MSQSQNPWPAQTDPPPVPSPSRSNRKRRTSYARQPRGSSTDVTSRQVVADSGEIAQAKLNCMWNSGNEVISCFPTADTKVFQHQWATFVWNSRRPEITQTNLVDIYLFHGDSQQQIYHFHNIMNPTDQAGSITAEVNDTWFGDKAVNWNGQNISYPYYWVLTRSDKTLDGSEIPQATFSAIQTTYADSVASSMASSSSMASASSASASSVSASAASAHPSSNPGNIQSGLGDSSFPHWAIAVIAVLGFLALAAICILIFLILRRMRQQKRSSNRNSMSSSSPMMANIQDTHQPSSPLLEGAGLAAVGTRAASSHGHQSVTSHEASTISRATSAEQGPFSGADAAIMADAFRKALRKPDFAGQPVEEGESPPEGSKNDDELIDRELAEEGRGIKSVDSSRGVTVETLERGS